MGDPLTHLHSHIGPQKDAFRSATHGTLGGSQREAEGKQQSKEEPDRCLSRADGVYRKDYSELL